MIEEEEEERRKGNVNVGGSRVVGVSFSSSVNQPPVVTGESNQARVTW